MTTAASILINLEAQEGDDEYEEEDYDEEDYQDDERDISENLTAAINKDEFYAVPVQISETLPIVTLKE